MQRSSNFPWRSPQTVTCLERAVEKWTREGSVFNTSLPSRSSISRYLACSVSTHTLGVKNGSMRVHTRRRTLSKIHKIHSGISHGLLLDDRSRPKDTSGERPLRQEGDRTYLVASNSETSRIKSCYHLRYPAD